jgi:hypothetical protein
VQRFVGHRHAAPALSIGQIHSLTFQVFQLLWPSTHSKLFVFIAITPFSAVQMPNAQAKLQRDRLPHHHRGLKQRTLAPSDSADCWATGPKAPYLGRPGEKSSGFGGPPTQLMSQALSTVMKSNVPSIALVHASCTIFFGT